jgi:hypothetical protein
VSDNLIQSADQKICERRHFTISELLREFPQISCTLLYEIITATKVLCKIGSENAHGYTQNAENSFDFLERYHKYGDGFLNHTLGVRGHENWVSFPHVETKEQSEK